MSTFKQYFDLTEKYRNEYGDKTILLMQIGGFYEMYGQHTNNIYIDEYSKFYDVCQLCNLKMSDKKEITDKNIKHTLSMAGFRIYSLEKYLKYIINAGYACVVYDQDEQKSGTTRSIQAIYTPGTYFDEEDTVISNNIICCWLHKYKNTIVFGVSCINIITGKTYIYEYDKFYDLSPDTFDELERFISTFSPNEVIIIHNCIELSNPNQLIDLCNINSQIRTSVISLVEDNDDNIMIKRANNSTKQIYQDEVYTKFFNMQLSIQCTDMLYNYSIASQSLCFLLDYIYQNNPHLVSNIEPPIFENQSDRIILGNHSLKQLNIIEQTATSRNKVTYSSSYVESYSTEIKKCKKRYNSICDLLNYCKTSMGMRLFHYTMTHPHSNINILNRIYDTTEYCKNELDNSNFNDILHSLGGMFDIEKIIRKVLMSKSNIDDIVRLYTTLTKSLIILNKIKENEIFIKYFKEIANISLDMVYEFCNNQIIFLETVFNKEVLDSNNNNNTINIFKLGVYDNHDKKVFDKYLSWYRLKIVYYYLVEQVILAEQYKSKNKKEKSYKKDPVKLNETDKGNISFEVTATRSKVLSEYLNRNNNNNNIVTLSKNDCEYRKKVIEDETIPNYLLNNTEFIDTCLKEFSIETNIDIDKAGTLGQKTLKNNYITAILRHTQYSKEKLEESVKYHFYLFNNNYKNTIKDYNIIVKFCSHIDMLMCYTQVCKNNNYSRPIIENENENENEITTGTEINKYNSYCDFEGLRHPLIENLIENEIYVANSLYLTNEETDEIKRMFNYGRGFLLYGTNTVGKSSFIKSIGIAVIMAQCGFYVSAEKMRFMPFKSIYTRILGNDNLFRGLSTFNVEMIELKNILNYADENSLILGDEVCSGTEIGSASSIFMSALEYLYNKKSKFIFATHFHNILEFNELNNLHLLKHIHLSVFYDKNVDKLIYDRKLKEGSGENMYGLEVCKYLHLPDDFISRSYEIRNKYFSDNTSLLDLKSSKYNSKKLVGNCEKCCKKGIEVHHLQFQRHSDKDGYIKNNTLHQYFHKNKKANLMVLCNKCHDELHKESSNGHYRKSGDIIKNK